MTAIIYGRPNCIWCDRAKEALENINMPYTYKDISDPKIKAELMAQVPMARTVPQIWINEYFYVGTFDDLSAYLVEREQRYNDDVENFARDYGHLR